MDSGITDNITATSGSDMVVQPPKCVFGGMPVQKEAMALPGVLYF